MKIFIISLIIAVLSGMGVGGGGLLVIYLTLFENTDQLIAQGANLAFFLFAGIASTAYSLKRKKIVWKTTLPLSISGALASILGSLAASNFEPNILRKIFGGMLILGGIGSLISTFGKNKQKKNI
jgi:uncharacterized membrane protein YfcA